MVQFGHRDWGLQVGTWADDGIPRCGAHALGVRAAEAVLEEDLECHRHGASLSEGQRANDKVGRESLLFPFRWYYA